MESLQWELIFCNTSLECCIIRQKKPRMKIEGNMLYLAVELMN